MELYKFLWLTQCRYTSWCETNIIRKGVKGIDYIDLSDSLTYYGKPRKKRRFKIMISLDFAIAITFRYDSLLAKSLRRELEKDRDYSKME